jgi:hypothetical protein
MVDSPRARRVVGVVTRARKLFTDWTEGQGAKIKSARPLATYGACASMARRLAETLPPEYSRLLLLQEQIEKCDMQALTSARNVRFGPPPADEESWRSQLDQIRADWQTPERKAA